MVNGQEIKVLLVEGNATARPILVEVLKSDPKIQVIAVVESGADAIGALEGERPDVVLMDLDLPGMDGYETTRRIMETRPVPIVVCTQGSGAVETFKMTEMGAVAGVEKPVSRTQGNFATVASNLLQTVKLMSEIKVVRRWKRPAVRDREEPRSGVELRSKGRTEIIGIGASTGGPPVLQAIFMGLPKDFPVPIVVVQHIAPGFLTNLVDWLGQTTGYAIGIAQDNERTQPGRAYVAPDDRHMAVRADGRIWLTRSATESGVRPSVSHLFRSLADGFGANAAGVQLTGMGRDGVDELKRIKDLGGFTIAQDRETSVVYGMPGEAIKIGGATLVLPPDRIAPALVSLVNQQIIPGPLSP